MSIARSAHGQISPIAAGPAIPRSRNAIASANVSPPPAESPAITVFFGSRPSASNAE